MVFKFIINTVDFQRCYQISGVTEFNECGTILSDRNQFFAFVIKFDSSAGRSSNGFELVIPVNKSPSFFIQFAVKYPAVTLRIVSLGGIGFPFRIRGIKSATFFCLLIKFYFYCLYPLSSCR